MFLHHKSEADVFSSSYEARLLNNLYHVNFPTAFVQKLVQSNIWADWYE